MKRCCILMMATILVCVFSLSALGMTPDYYLRSRLTNLTAELYKEMSEMIEPGADEYFSLVLLPFIDVNGDAADLAIFLHQRMTEVISQFPGLRVAGYAETVKTWNELHQQKLSDAERFRLLGNRLNVSAVIMTSLVTHSTHYTLNGMVVNAATGYQHEIEQIILERGLIDALPKEQIAAAVKAQAESLKNPDQTAQGSKGSAGQSGVADPSGTDQDQSGKTQPSAPGLSDQGATEAAQPADAGSGALKPDQPSDGAGGQSDAAAKPGDTAQPVKPGTQPGGGTEAGTPRQSGDSALPGPGSSETGTASGGETSAGVKPAESSHRLVLKEQSPPLSSIMLAMDMGDFNGDGVDELVYCAGPSIHVRNLTNYYFLWTYDQYQPTTRDYKVLAVDLDGDGKDEIASHGSLLKVVNNKLTAQQPRFVARPVTVYKQSGIALFDKTSIYVVNFQGLVMRQFVVNAAVKRFVFADLEGDGHDEIIALMDGEAENLKAQIYKTLPYEAKQTLSSPKPIEGTFSTAIRVLDLNQNGLPELYLSKNFFSGDRFLYSKIFVYESVSGQLKQVAESSELSYFIVDFAGYPKKVPNRLAVGVMTLQSKTQSPAEIKSRVLYFAFESNQ